jgi:hypothetical protein
MPQSFSLDNNAVRLYNTVIEQHGATMFTADQVWGLAVRADLANGGYVKEDQWDYSQTTPVLVHRANKLMVKEWLRENRQPDQQEITQGQEYRRYFNGFTLKAIMGKITDFERQALRIAQIDQFTGRNLLEFAVVSCLPSVARKDQKQTDLKRELYTSTQLLGNIGDTIAGDITVISSRYNPTYNKFRVNARMGEAFVDFWFTRDVEGEVRIKGKIKALRGDKSTQLNYVKLL